MCNVYLIFVCINEQETDVMQVCCGENLATCTNRAMNEIKHAVKSKKEMVVWDDGNMHPVYYYTDVLRLASKRGRVVRFIRWCVTYSNTAADSTPSLVLLVSQSAIRSLLRLPVAVVGVFIAGARSWNLFIRRYSCGGV